MGITATGIGSGIDVESIVTQLVLAESLPIENRLNQQEFTLQSELSAYGTLKGALSTFQSALGSARSLSTFQQRQVTLSSTEEMSVTASNIAPTGNFSVAVTQLANAHSLASIAFTDPEDIVGEGTLTFRFGTTDYDSGTDTYNSFTLNEDSSTVAITIDSSNNTLSGIRDAINAASAGVSAAIVNDGSGYRLLLSSESSGVINSMELSADDDDLNDTDLNGLSRLTFNSSAHHLEQTVAAADALATINGLAVTSASNKLSGVIDGVEMQLKSTTTTAVGVDIQRDTAVVRSAIESVVNGYRAFAAVVNQLGEYDAETEQGSILLGDSTLRATAGRIRQVLNDSVDNVSSSIKTLSEMGITTDANGSLNIDDAKLDALLEDNFDELPALFAPFADITDSNIDFVNSTSATEVGDYDITVSQLATQAVNAGNGVLPDFGSGGTVTIDANNDNLTFEINGVTGTTINLTQGVYTTGESLAKEIQTRINGVQAFKDVGITVVVDYDDVFDTLTVRSSIYGSDAAVNITGVDATTATTLGFLLQDGTDGLDVAGTIDGVAFTGTGQVFTAPEGTGAEGLSLLVSGGATGARGAVGFSRGIADQLDKVITDLLAEGGLLSARTDGLQSSIDEIVEDREDLALRMEIVETRLREQFTAMDTLVAQLQNTGSFLTTALASIPVPGSQNQRR